MMKRVFWIWTGVVALGFLAGGDVRAQEGEVSSGVRMLELSSRGLPISGTLRFLDAEETTLETLVVSDERFFWHRVPEGAVAFDLKPSLEGMEAVKRPLFETGSTFAGMNPSRPVVEIQQAQAVADVPLPRAGSLVRRPLVEEPRQYDLVVPGTIGWVFVGKLETAEEASQWASLYLVRADTLRKPDADAPFPFAALAAVVTSGNSEKRVFVADFPLVLRPTETEESKSGFPIIRAGQTFEILQLVRQEANVRARVKVR